MRNGIVADTLRKAGSPYKIIFGLNIPQLREIALEFGPDDELAAQLMDNISTRESMLIAPMLMQPASMSVDRIINLTARVNEVEQADIMVHRLLRPHPEKDEILRRLWNADDDFSHYMALRMTYADIMTNPSEAQAKAQAELTRNRPLTNPLAKIIISEAQWLLQPQ